MNINKQPIYPVEPWNITETEFCMENNYRNETTFALSNGYIGTRGTFEEAYDLDINTGLEGNFINGFYESEDIRYGEASFGFPLHSQSLLNLPNLKAVRIILEDETFSLLEGKVEQYSRTLHMKEGTLSRHLTWTSPKGKKLQFEFRRLVSFSQKNLMGEKLIVTSENYTGEITFVSRLQGNVENHTRKTNPIVDYGPFGRRLGVEHLTADANNMFYQGVTKKSLLTVACGSTHVLTDSSGQILESDKCECITREFDADVSLSGRISQGSQISFEKFICYSSDLDMKKEALKEFVCSLLEKAKNKGYVSFEIEQKQYMEEFWDVADVEIDGDDALQQGMRFNLFHIMQSAGRDGRTGMGAKGLSGEGYEGHYFWDTEMYVLPVFIYTNPELAKKLLDYRYDTLEHARARARVLGHDKGALYPWRTINGEEASTYFPLGTAQYHINADISYALSLYMQVTGDMDYLADKGAEILVETARVWADVGSFAKCKGGKYCICDVTGPDEYNVLVDNNFYTNLMARENLRDAVKAIEYLKENAPHKYDVLVGKLRFEESEKEMWEKIIENMYFPYDEEREIYPLDDGFMMRKPWDESRIPAEKRAWLYENYHPLFIMRHRMSKQADSMLGMYLYNQYFSKEELKRNYDFYQEVTLHHSSLSTCIFGIVACDIGYYDEAFEYFSQSARMDLDDYHNNFYAGIHAANMAGTWQAIVNGFAGLRCNEGFLRFKPYLPKQWSRCSFKLRYQGTILKITMKPGKVEFSLLRGRSISFVVNDKTVSLETEGGTYIEKI